MLNNVLSTVEEGFNKPAVTPGHKFSKELTSLRPPPYRYPQNHHTTHSLEGDGKKKVGVALYPLCQAQHTSQRQSVPDWENTIQNNIVSNDLLSQTDNTQINIYTKIYNGPDYRFP